MEVNRVRIYVERVVAHFWDLPQNSGTAVAQWLKHYATNRKVAGSFPDGVIGIFH